MPSKPVTHNNLTEEIQALDQGTLVLFDRCGVCGSDEVRRLPDDWQEQLNVHREGEVLQADKTIPIVACGNPWHYAVRSLGDS